MISVNFFQFFANKIVDLMIKKSKKYSPLIEFHPREQPFRPEFSDLNYADVDYRSYGPINYKAASIYAAAQKQRNESETESEDYLL